MATSDAPGGHWVQGSTSDEIRFFPPLSEQRQGWALSVLKNHLVKSVLEVGCGEGNLLRALISPAPTVRETAILSENASEAEVARNTFLHVETLAGLDIDRGSLERFAAQFLPSDDPRDQSNKTSTYAPRRWTNLDVSLWEGDLTAFNLEFAAYEAIVALEVIEHLEPNVLDKFGPVVLGEYRPKFLLVSTPNFTFNQRFDRQRTNQRGFLDPTGRTQRVFRNDDHKMEWTPAEFQDWADDLARDFGYSVTTSLIGEPLTTSPPPCLEATAASQVAVFVRQSTTPPEAHRSPRSVVPAALPFFHPTGNALPQHKLVKRGRLEAAEYAGQSVSDEEVREEVRGLMEHWGRGELGLSEVWPELGGVVGGSRIALIKALGGWGNVPPPSSPSPSSTPLDLSEFHISSHPSHDGTLDAQLLRIKWRDFDAVTRGGADSPIEGDETRGYGEDDEDGWGPRVEPKDSGKQEINGW